MAAVEVNGMREIVHVLGLDIRVRVGNVDVGSQLKHVDSVYVTGTLNFTGHKDLSKCQHAECGLAALRETFLSAYEQAKGDLAKLRAARVQEKPSKRLKTKRDFFVPG